LQEFYFEVLFFLIMSKAILVNFRSMLFYINQYIYELTQFFATKYPQDFIFVKPFYINQCLKCVPKAIKFFDLFVKQVFKTGCILRANIRTIVWSTLKYLQLDIAY